MQHVFKEAKIDVIHVETRRRRRDIYFDRFVVQLVKRRTRIRHATTYLDMCKGRHHDNQKKLMRKHFLLLHFIIIVIDVRKPQLNDIILFFQTKASKIDQREMKELAFCCTSVQLFVRDAKFERNSKIGSNETIL